MASQHKIWADGELVDWDDATVHVSAHALHYGSSIFEGIRAYGTPQGLAVLGLPQHTRRFAQSARIFKMELPFSEEEINNAILETLRVNDHPAAYIRPLAIRGAGPLGVDGRKNPVNVFIMTMEWGDYLGEGAVTQGVDVMVSSWRRIAPDTHPGLAKIGGNYVNSQLIVMEARELGFVEGIALDINGLVSEGSGENLFLVLDGIIYTPPLASSILSGITRRFVMQLIEDHGYEVRRQSFPREMLYVADELFFTGTAVEVTPIRSVDGYQIGKGSRGPITEAIQRDFFAIARGETEDRHGWLTHVHAREQAAVG
jgi:branched-chain amino acid aminotransferase